MCLRRKPGDVGGFPQWLDIACLRRFYLGTLHLYCGYTVLCPNISSVPLRDLIDMETITQHTILRNINNIHE